MMLFNPITMRLFTSDRKLIKQLHCPMNVKWDETSRIRDNSDRNCEHCSRRVRDIECLSEDEVLSQVTKDPSMCIKLGLDYKNIRMITLDD